MESTYGEGSPETPPDETETESPPESIDEENAERAEILIAKSQLPAGTKEGDTCTFRVVKDLGDEFSLKYVKEGEGQTAQEPMSEVSQELTALSDEGE